MGQNGRGRAPAVRILAAREVKLFAGRLLLSDLVGTNRAKLRLALFAALRIKRFGTPGGGRVVRNSANVAERRVFGATTLEGFLDAA
jgi:hypothetical protein